MKGKWNGNRCPNCSFQPFPKYDEEELVQYLHKVIRGEVAFKRDNLDNPKLSIQLWEKLIRDLKEKSYNKK